MSSPTHDRPEATTRASDTETAKAAAEDLSRDVKDTARNLKDSAMNEAQSRAETAKEGVADELSSVSKALRHASDELRQGSPQERTFGYMAGAIADLADTVRDKDLGEMVENLSDFARRNPAAFLGGAALLGFAGVRMAKASRRAGSQTGADQVRDEHFETARHHTSHYSGSSAQGTQTPGGQNQSHAYTTPGGAT
jgi:hypothetical protein